MTAPKDPWSSEIYTGKVAPFAPLLTSRVVSLLNPQPSDKILDLGCGDGVLTSQLSARCHHITGLDASANMIASAQAMYSTPTTSYQVLDCRDLLSSVSELRLSGFDKVFSNAALHWILRDGSTRCETLRGVHAALVPGGVFVVEMGAHGNVAEAHAALIAALVHRGVEALVAREASPWFFPTEEHMRGLLEDAGFVVEVMETELRQTRLTTETGGGLEGWVRLFGTTFWEALEKVGGEEARESGIKEVMEVLEGVGRREDGGFYLNYIRLRFVARKPE